MLALLLLLCVALISANHYETLGLRSDASEQAIRRAYRRAALTSHPDKQPHGRRAAAARRMEVLNEAYAALGDADARRRYDYELAMGAASGGRSSYSPHSENRRRVSVHVACTLEQLGGFAAVKVDLQSALGVAAAGRRIPPLQRWLPPGSHVGDKVRRVLSLSLRLTLCP
jgi:curved DNA-binding protein CbpA